MHNRGIVAGMLAAVAVLASLTGCSSLAEDESSSAAGLTVAQETLQNPVIPFKGECWSTTYEAFMAEPEVAVGTAVKCSSAHQAYTFAVADLSATSDFSQAPTAADQLCGKAFDLFVPNSAGVATRLLLTAAIPSSAQWQSGSRWARCNIQLTAAGSSFSFPTLAVLPTDIATLVSTEASSPDTYAMCVTSPGSNGDTGPQLNSAVIADCSSGAWRIEPTNDFPDPPGAPYPTASALESYMHPQCGGVYDTATTRGWVFYPNESEWEQDDRSFMCWVGKR